MSRTVAARCTDGNAMDAYLNTVASALKVPADHRTVWKQTVLKTPKLRHKYGCSDAHIDMVAKIRKNPEWKKMCKKEPLHKYLDEMAAEEPLQFKFDDEDGIY